MRTSWRIEQGPGIFELISNHTFPFALLGGWGRHKGVPRSSGQIDDIWRDPGSSEVPGRISTSTRKSQRFQSLHL